MSISVKVSLLENMKDFTNSSYVNGFISLTSREDVQIDSVTVLLIGSSKVNTSKVIKAEVHCFLEVEDVIYTPMHQLPSPCLVANKTSEHSFSLQFPAYLPHGDIQKIKAGFLKSEPDFNAFMLPPSFDFASVGDSSFGCIEYHVVAKIKYSLMKTAPASSSAAIVPLLLGTGKGQTATGCHKILFKPKNDFIKYPISNITIGNNLLFPNYSNAFACTKIKRALSNSTLNKGSRFSPFYRNSNGHETLHIGMQVHFKPTWETLIPALGNTARIVQSEIPLSSFLDVEFVLPEFAFLGANAPLAYLPASKCPYIVFTHLNVELITQVHLKAQSCMSVENTEVLYQGPISHQAHLSQFVKYENDNTMKFQDENGTSIQKPGTNIAVYKYKMPSELLGFAISGDFLPSFVTKNIKRDYSLRVVLECQLPGGVKEKITLKMDSKIILLNHENFNERFYENVDPLPLYTRIQ